MREKPEVMSAKCVSVFCVHSSIRVFDIYHPDGLKHSKVVYLNFRHTDEPVNVNSASCVCQWRNTGEERSRTLSRCALPLLSPPLFTSPPPCSLSPLLSSTSTTLSSSSPPPHSEPIAALTPPSDSGPSRIFPLSVRSNPFFFLSAPTTVT